mmetsp:Transcript_38272/g.83365  ORF Transcript_38272/g.83365 Transcript_38272/m.83365 type:complete len:434 (-) Transcript_38272:79-1380(-)
MATALPLPALDGPGENNSMSGSSDSMLPQSEGCHSGRPPSNSEVCGGVQPTLEVCGCGNMFLPDSSFCSKCGAGRPSLSSNGSSGPGPDIAELLALFKGLQVGAAQGVFEKVRQALSDAAETALAGINANMQTVTCAMAGLDGTGAALEAIGFRKPVPLGNTGFSCHIGFHTQQQTICHLLHLVVQLTLFPQDQMVNFSAQAGVPFSGYTSSEAQAEVKVAVSSSQTPPPPPPPPKKPGPCVGVRIGGGYHLFQTPEENSNDDELPEEEPLGGTLFPPSRPPSPPRTRPLLEDMAKETLRISPTQSPPHRQDPRELTPEHPVQKKPYVLGARSDGTPSERFRVGAFMSRSAETAVIRDKEIRGRRDGEGVQLSRYLGPPAYAALESPRAPGQRKARPVSARLQRETVRQLARDEHFPQGSSPAAVPRLSSSSR